MLLIWARVIILGYMAVNESNHWHKACHTPVRWFQLSLIEPLPVDVFTTITNNNNNKTKAFEKDGERRARWSYVPLHLWWAWLWHKRDAQRRILHRVVYFFPMAETTTVISSPSTSGWRSRENILSMCRKLDPIHCRLHERSVGIWIELSRGLNSIASNPIRFLVRLRCLHELNNSILL